MCEKRSEPSLMCTISRLLQSLYVSSEPSVQHRQAQAQAARSIMHTRGGSRGGGDSTVHMHCGSGGSGGWGMGSAVRTQPAMDCAPAVGPGPSASASSSAAAAVTATAPCATTRFSRPLLASYHAAQTRASTHPPAQMAASANVGAAGRAMPTPQAQGALLGDELEAWPPAPPPPQQQQQQRDGVLSTPPEPGWPTLPPLVRQQQPQRPAGHERPAARRGVGSGASSAVAAAAAALFARATGADGASKPPAAAAARAAAAPLIELKPAASNALHGVGYLEPEPMVARRL